MRTINYTHLGGAPLTQETLDWHQTAMKDIAKAIARMGDDGSGNPFILSGCVYNSGTGIVTDGYMFYADEIHYFQGGDTGALGTAVQLTTLNTDAVYEDGSTHTMYVEKVMTLGGGAPNTSIITMKRFHEFFGAKGYESEERTISIAAGSVFAATTLYYRINYLSKMLHIRCDVTVNAPASVANPAIYYQIATLPAGFRPTQVVPFKGFVRYHLANYIKDVGTIDYIKDVNCEVRTDGNLNIGFIKPEAGVVSYTVSFNTAIPLI